MLDEVIDGQIEPSKSTKSMSELLMSAAFAM